MLLIGHYLAISEIHGLGVFASEDIQAGTVIWRFEKGYDFTLSKNELKKLPLKTQNWIRHFGYYNKTEGGWVICIDDGRFVNHSEDNNISDRGDHTIANRFIKSGTELTCNYYEFDEVAGDKIKKMNSVSAISKF